MRDRKFLKSTIGFEINDVIFKQHLTSQNTLNFFIISFQFLICIVGLVISAVTSFNISKYTAVVNVVLCIVVVANNLINSKAWNVARKRQDKIIAMYDIVDDERLTDEDVHYHISKLKGYKIKHSDDRLEVLLDKWYSNMECQREKLIYKDINGVNYHIGDIVLNSFFGDVWLVEKLSNKDMKKFGFKIPYVFTQYGDENEYIMQIDEPSGFAIECTPDDMYEYAKYLSLFTKAYRILQEELKYNGENKNNGK